jgi:hypothetical protein
MSELSSAQVATKPIARWLSGRVAAERLGVNAKSLPGLVKRRLLTCRSIPGVPARYLESSVERLLQRCTSVADEAGEKGDEAGEQGSARG